MADNCKTTFESEVNKFNTLDFNPAEGGFIWKDSSGNIMPRKDLVLREGPYEDKIYKTFAGLDYKKNVFDMEGVQLTNACWEYIKDIIKYQHVVNKSVTADLANLKSLPKLELDLTNIVNLSLVTTEDSPDQISESWLNNKGEFTQAAWGKTFTGTFTGDRDFFNFSFKDPREESAQAKTLGSVKISVASDGKELTYELFDDNGIKLQIYPEWKPPTQSDVDMWNADEGEWYDGPDEYKNITLEEYIEMNPPPGPLPQPTFYNQGYDWWYNKKDLVTSVEYGNQYPREKYDNTADDQGTGLERDKSLFFRYYNGKLQMIKGKQINTTPAFQPDDPWHVGATGNFNIRVPKKNGWTINIPALYKEVEKED